MKRLKLLIALAILNSTIANAQQTKWPRNSEMIFNDGIKNAYPITFRFNQTNNTTIRIRLQTLSQLQYIQNTDTLLRNVKQVVNLLQDSLPPDGITRSIDIASYPTGAATIRVVSFSSHPATYKVQEGNLKRIKLDPDTVRVVLYLAANKKFDEKNTGKMIIPVDPVAIEFIGFNLNALATLPDNTLSTNLDLVKNEINRMKYASRRKYWQAAFDMQSGKLTSSSTYPPGEYRPHSEFIPTISVGLQFARGSFLPSAAAGLQFIRNRSNSSSFFRLLWEPYFHFEKPVDKVETFRNDFITLQFMQLSEEKKGLNTTPHFSVGYLAMRRGTLFEENTFKVGIPGFVWGNLFFSPEFIFNDGFKNFSPSLKMNLLFE